MAVPRQTTVSNQQDPLLSNNNSHLIRYINGMTSLSPELKQALQGIIFTRTLRKKEILIKEGDQCTTIFFIVKGLTRAYVVRNRKDITLWISIENEFETAVESFFNGTPARENIEALEDCNLEGIEAKDLQDLAKRFPETNAIVTQLMQAYYIGSEERALMGRLTNASEKYKYLLEIRPHLLLRAPLKHIASFMGIRLETLSRLRNKNSRTGKIPPTN